MIFAIAQGIGDPSIPSEAVAVVEEAPEGLGTVTEGQFQHALVQTAAQEKIKPLPKPGDEKFEELKEKALGELLDSIWIQGQAEEMGIAVTPKEVAEELAKLKNRPSKPKSSTRNSSPKRTSPRPTCSAA